MKVWPVRVKSPSLSLSKDQYPYKLEIPYSIGAGGRKSRPQTRRGRMKEASHNLGRESQI